MARTLRPTAVELCHIDSRRTKVVFISTRDKPYRLQSHDDVFGRREFDGSSIFEALRGYRNLVEPLGWRVLCNGARLDAYHYTQGGRDEKEGWYVDVIDPRTGCSGILKTLGPAEISRVGTVSEQEAYVRNCETAFGGRIPQRTSTRSTIVKVLHQDGSVASVQLEYSVVEPFAILCVPPVGGRKKFESGDLFDAFSELRKVAEGIGDTFLCNGSRVNVHPIGAMRDLGHGELAYVLNDDGKALDGSDEVNIFDPAPLDQIGTTEQQQRYFREWRARNGI